jgi:hypothetical protein
VVHTGDNHEKVEAHRTLVRRLSFTGVVNSSAKEFDSIITQMPVVCFSHQIVNFHFFLSKILFHVVASLYFLD